MNRLYRGNAIAQYAIIICLVVFGCIAMYKLLGENISLSLGGFSSSLQNSKKAVSFTNSNGTVVSYQPGDLKGTPNAPVTECNNDTCVIDYGDYLLNGIPANFSDESISSRGNDDLTKAMASMIQQLEADNDPPDEDLSDLIDLIKQAIITNNKISDAEEIIEIAAFDVYIKPTNPDINHPNVVNEISTHQILLNNVQDNKLISILSNTNPPLIDIPAVGEKLSPEYSLFYDQAYLDPNLPYKDVLLNSTEIKSNTINLMDLKTQITDLAAKCGKSEQAEIIAYMIDLSNKVSTNSIKAYNQGPAATQVKGIIDNMDVDITKELINLAKDIDPSLGGNPLTPVKP